MGRLGGYDVILHAIPQIEIHLELLRLCFTIALGILFNLELVDETWLSGLMRLAEKMLNHGQQILFGGSSSKDPRNPKAMASKSQDFFLVGPYVQSLFVIMYG